MCNSVNLNSCHEGSLPVAIFGSVQFLLERHCVIAIIYELKCLIYNHMPKGQAVCVVVALTKICFIHANLARVAAQVQLGRTLESQS
jgi:hypothetical protein